MVFTTDGKEELAKFFGGDSAVYPTYTAFGDSSTAASVSDTALGNELARYAATATVNGALVEHESTIPTTDLNGSTLRETGLLSSTSSGVLSERTVFFDITKGSTFEVRAITQTRFI